jgi:integrase
MVIVGRPPLAPGTFGKVLFLDHASGKVQARAIFRDYDGRTRLVSKLGKTRAAAERALKAELANRQAPAGSGVIGSTTRVDTLADVWLAGGHDWSSGTRRTYDSIVRNQVKPALGGLRIQEVSPGVISRALKAIAERSGPSASKSARACLSGMFGLAIEDGAIRVNPVRDSSAKISVERRSPRALTIDETARLVALFRASARAVELDLPDVVDWMLATGGRIGETLALREDLNSDGRPILDRDVGTWEVNATVVRVGGRGLTIQPRPKSAAGWRVVALPGFALALLAARPSVRADGVVFTAPVSRTLRDPTNVSGDLRQLLDSFECDECAGTGYQIDDAGSFRLAANGRRIRCAIGPWSWVTSHTFRKTVATRLDEAGFTARQVADQLGHANPSMTQDVYFGRRVVSAAAAQVLDR